MNNKIEKQFVITLTRFCDKSFIISALHLMNTDEKRKAIIDYVINNPDVTQKEVDEKMFYISIGKE
jgi:hypothetical protein